MSTVERMKTPAILWRSAPLEAYLSSLSATSRRLMERRLEHAAELLGVDHKSYPWHSFGAEELEHLRDLLLVSGAAPATVNVALAAVKGVVRAVHGHPAQARERDVAVRLERLLQVRRVPVDDLQEEVLSVREFAALLAVCLRDRSPSGSRDAALICVLRWGPLSCRQAVDLAIDDFAHDPPVLMVRPARQGRQNRVVTLPVPAANALAGWVAVRGKRPGTLFVAIRRDGSVTEHALVARAALYVLRRRLQEACLPTVGPQALRRSATEDAFSSDAGRDYAVQISVGPEPTANEPSKDVAQYDMRAD